MQYSSVTGTPKRRNVPVELIVIGIAVALGAMFANGRAPAADKPSPSAADGGSSVETSYPPADQASETAAPAATSPRAVAAPTGTPSSVAMPAGVPADMPVLKDATLVSASADDGAGEYVLTWAVSGAGAAAAPTAYARQLEAKGWEVTSSNDNPGSTVLVFERAESKGGGRGWVAFIGDAPDVSATLTLSLAR